MLGGLHVDPERMRRNLNLTNGLIVAEAVMMALAPHIGRDRAHELVTDACRKVNQDGNALASVLAAMPDVTTHLDRDAITRLTNPANYLGLAGEMVDRVLAGHPRT
jgi:3-carboxy-cis,cis-muconate cycloisomerase